MQANEIYDEIKQIMSTSIPKEAKGATFPARIYENVTQGGLFWFLENGKEDTFEMEDELGDEINEKIENLLKTLQKDMVSKNEPWTHCKITLSDKGEFNIEFADIPQEDSWGGLFLKRVSDLSFEEVKKHCYIPKKEWKKRKILYGKES